MTNITRDKSQTSRTFLLVRTEDVSGVSGKGVVAEGIEFADGQVVLSWLSKHHTLEILPSIEKVETVHGHDGKTTIVWD